MLVKINPASRRAKGEGKRIRRARNIVKRWESGGWVAHTDKSDVARKRYQRAVAILVETALLGE